MPDQKWCLTPFCSPLKKGAWHLLDTFSFAAAAGVAPCYQSAGALINIDSFECSMVPVPGIHSCQQNAFFPSLGDHLRFKICLDHVPGDIIGTSEPGTIHRLIGPLLIVVGLVLLGLFNLKLPGVGVSKGLQRRVDRSGVWGAGVLGILFAFAFCPVSAALFFGSLVPPRLPV